MAPNQARNDEIKVFVSYSRNNLQFVSRLKDALQTRSITAYVDRDEIEKGEEWWKRIQELIAEADAIVFVLSPGFIASKTCKDELEFAIALKKRLLPIVAENLIGLTVPDTLAKRNYVYFIPNPPADASGSFEDGLNELVRAIKTDIDWIREHTRIGVLARRWWQRGRPKGHLLKGQEIDDAFGWAERRPGTAPRLTDAQDEFLMASKFVARNPIKLFSTVGALTIISGSMSIVALNSGSSTN